MLVETKSLTKRYGEFVALHDCNIRVPKGEIFGLLGPNGAGKSTFLRLLLGFLRPTSGQATINGLDCYSDRIKVHRQVSYLPGDAKLYQSMRGHAVLRFFSDLRQWGNVEFAQVVADRLELDLTRRVGSMSTGMRQKLALAITFAADTPLLVLDEPTANLDPNVRSEVTKMVAEERKKGRTVLFSSHVLSEVEEICDRVVILRQGVVVHSQSMEEIRKQHRILAEIDGPLPPLPQRLRGHLKIQSNPNGQIVIETADELSPILGWLATLPLKDVVVDRSGLRSIYDQFHGDWLQRRTTGREANR